ncbi:MAG: nuclease-related domain-containing protein, partial [Acidithiobacillus sp.]|nr:nuclease-related domain-containing protein [Acidithiobacillus sp.]
MRNELYRFRSGNKGEQDTAYYLDVRFRDTPNWIVLHDLRLTGGTDVVQIDHLLINRVMEFFILETKRFQGKTLRITEEGEFLLEENEQVRSLPSPIAQNDRHITILKRILQAQQVLPKKLFSPVFYNYVLIHPDTRIERLRIPAIVGSDSADRGHPRKAYILVTVILCSGGH